MGVGKGIRGTFIGNANVRGFGQFLVAVLQAVESSQEQRLENVFWAYIIHSRERLQYTLKTISQKVSRVGIFKFAGQVDTINQS